jgi:hypothetical protein
MLLATRRRRARLTPAALTVAVSSPCDELGDGPPTPAQKGGLGLSYAPSHHA